MLCFHTNAYALPSDAVAGPTITLRGEGLSTIISPDGGPPRYLATMPTSFDVMQRRLLAMPRCDCEPDGFFLVTGRDGDHFWRLNGHMHEYAPEPAEEPLMHRVELNGECPAAALDDVLRAMGWPERAIAFELVQEGVSLDEGAFRRYAGAT